MFGTESVTGIKVKTFFLWWADLKLLIGRQVKKRIFCSETFYLPFTVCINCYANVNIPVPSLCAGVRVRRRGGVGEGRSPCSRALGAGRSYGAARVAAGLAVVPVAAQVDLQRQQAVGGGTILAALIWDTVNTQRCSSLRPRHKVSITSAHLKGLLGGFVVLKCTEFCRVCCIFSFLD